MLSKALYCAITFICALSWSPRAVMGQGDTACKTTSLDWYTSVVGETPCQTYQSLRQICNAEYTVGALSTATPPDSCNDQVAGCCCNSVSFALSMLCLNCQQGVGSGVAGDNGIDAGVGAYQDYLGACAPNVNQSLPTNIQAAVCNEKIKIDDNLYSLFWGDGSWYYIYSKETVQAAMIASANNSFTHCPSTTVSTTSAAPAAPVQSSSSSSVVAVTSASVAVSVISSSASSVGSASSASSASSVGSASSVSTSLASTTHLTSPLSLTSISSAGSTSVAPSSSTSNTPAALVKTSSLSGGAKGGIAIAVILGVALAAFLLWFCLRRRRESTPSVDNMNGRQMEEAAHPYEIEPYEPQPNLPSDAAPTPSAHAQTASAYTGMAPSAPTSSVPTSRHANNLSVDPTESSYNSSNAQLPAPPLAQQTPVIFPAPTSQSTNRSSDPAESGYASFHGPPAPAPPVVPQRPPMDTAITEKSALSLSWNREDEQARSLAAPAPPAGQQLPTLNTADTSLTQALLAPSPVSPLPRQTLNSVIAQKMVRTDDDEQAEPNSSTARLLPSPPIPHQSYEQLPERHMDGGLLSGSGLGRSPSGRLPPAYGEQLD